MPPIPLPAILDTAAATPLRQTLCEAITAGRPLVLDGAGVERIGQASLQVLVAGERAAARAAVDFRILAPSPALAEMATLAGLDSLLAA